MRRHNNLATRNGAARRCSRTDRPFLRRAGDVDEDTMTKRETIYAKFEGFEEELAHCYFLLHGRFIANSPLAKFWVEAAMDELQHCSILRFCRERGLMRNANIHAKTAKNIEGLL